MAQNVDIITLNDKPALLGISSPEWLEVVNNSLHELGYKIHRTENHGEFLANFAQFQYHVAVLEDIFMASGLLDNLSLIGLQGLPMVQRRHCTVILVGENFTSLNPMEAFIHGVHAVVNRTEMFLTMQLIQKVTNENDVFLQTLREMSRQVALERRAS
jgi:hypothetical protein